MWGSHTFIPEEKKILAATSVTPQPPSRCTYGIIWKILGLSWFIVFTKFQKTWFLTLTLRSGSESKLSEMFSRFVCDKNVKIPHCLFLALTYSQDVQNCDGFWTHLRFCRCTYHYIVLFSSYQFHKLERPGQHPISLLRMRGKKGRTNCCTGTLRKNGSAGYLWPKMIYYLIIEFECSIHQNYEPVNNIYSQMKQAWPLGK